VARLAWWRTSRVIESFAPTTGRVLGVITLVIGAVILVDIIVEWRTWPGLTTAAVVLAVSAFVWLALVRPSVVAYPDVMVIRNILSDVHVPWHLVESVAIAPVLTVVAGGRSYRSSAIAVSGSDRRALRRAQRASVEAATQRIPTSAAELVNRPTTPADLGPSQYVVTRLTMLAEKHAEDSKHVTEVQRHWRWPEFVFIAVMVALAIVAAQLR
jgi:hypothetical protein